MKTYRVELINRNHFVVEVAENQYILGAIEAAGLRLPVGCRYRACITCAARLVAGKVNQSQAVGLKPSYAVMGYVLLCIAYPQYLQLELSRRYSIVHWNYDLLPETLV